MEKRRKGKIWVSLTKANSEPDEEAPKPQSSFFKTKHRHLISFFTAEIYSTRLLRNGKRWQFRQEGIEITSLVTSQKRTTQFHELAIFFYSLGKKKLF